MAPLTYRYMAMYEFAMQKISPHQLFDLQKTNPAVALLDVRTPAEHAEVHVPGVHLVPLDRLDAAGLASDPVFKKDTPIYLLCKGGGRATQAAEKLEKSGFTQCCVVEGGTQAWADAGLPVERSGRKIISLERQVRIAAGALVLTGVILGTWVHPGFYGLSAFVGAGLVFAGLTDWCGMGLLLGRMPWNQRVAASK